MKILLLAGDRVGSYSLMNWLCDELNLVLYDNEDEKTIDKDNIIHKVSKNNYDLNFYDKIIILYRENTMDQAISNVYANYVKKWHHSEDNLDGFYELDLKFMIENEKDILNYKEVYDKHNDILKNLNFGIKLSYENIFIEKSGQKIIEKYLNFKAVKSLHNHKNKLRKDNITYFFYNYILNKTNKEKEDLNKTIKELRKYEYKCGLLTKEKENLIITIKELRKSLI